MGCDTNDANKDATIDPEYNLERLHTPPSDEWYFDKCKMSDGTPCPYADTCPSCERGETPADNTYHPMTEKLYHQYEPQELDGETHTDPGPYYNQRTVSRSPDPNIPYYLPNINTTLPDPAYPAPEPDNMHITYYGTVEDVVFADGSGDDPQRQNGLASLSIRDEFDDLIHTDFHSLNPLSLLNESNVWNGKRVRVDIQDYKNVIEWFVYNYPMELVWYDKNNKDYSLLIPHKSDGVYKPHGDSWDDYTDSWAFDQFKEGMLKVKDNAKFQERWNALLEKQPWGKGRKKGGAGQEEDWEYEPGSGQNYYGETGYKELHRSFLEIGQMDGNKKISLWQFFELLKNYFHLDDLWWITRNQELRLSFIEWDTWQEDVERNNVIGPGNYPDDPEWNELPHGEDGSIPGSAIFEWLVNGANDSGVTHSNWQYDGQHTAPEGSLYFIGNLENKQFSIRMDYRDSIHKNADPDGDVLLIGRYSNGNQYKEVKGKAGVRLAKPGSIPKGFRPDEFEWINNYGITFHTIGAWEYLVNYVVICDLGVDVDGSIWVSTRSITNIHPHAHRLGIFNPKYCLSTQQGDEAHWAWLRVIPDEQVDIFTFGGVVTVGQGKYW